MIRGIIVGRLCRSSMKIEGPACIRAYLGSWFIESGSSVYVPLKNNIQEVYLLITWVHSMDVYIQCYRVPPYRWLFYYRRIHTFGTCQL